MAPRPTESRVENHAIGCFLQRAKLWHGSAAPCPWTATICYSQGCNCLAAFAFRLDLKPYRTSVCTEVELLIPRRSANWSQIMAPRPTASRIENHAIGCFLQRTKLWHCGAA